MSYPFKPNEKYIFSDQPKLVHTIHSIGESDMVFATHVDGVQKLVVRNINQFVRQIQNEEAICLEDIHPLKPEPKAYQLQLKDKFKPFMQVMWNLNQAGLPTTNHDAYEKICSTVRKEYPKTPVPYPKRSILAKRFKAYRESDGHSGVLIGEQRKSSYRVAENEMDFVMGFLQTKWQTSDSNSVIALFEQYQREVAKVSLNGISRTSFYELVNKMNEFDKEFITASTQKQNQMLRTYISKIKVSKALQRVEADRINLNLCLLNDQGELIKGNVRIYAMIDCYSRAILSMTYEFGTPEKLEGVVNSLTQVYLNAEVNPYSGRINELIVDNGPGYIPQELTEICSKLGITITRLPPSTPYKKPFIETFFRHFRLKFCQQHVFINEDTGEEKPGLPGYNGRSKRGFPKEGRKSNEQIASLTHAQFDKALKDFLDYYHQKTRQVLNGKSPQELWNESNKLYPIIPVNYEDIQHHFHYKRKSIALNQRGFVKLKNETFSSADLKNLYLSVKDQSRKGIEVIVAYNPADASHVTVGYETRCGKKFTYVVPNFDIDSFNGQVLSFAERNSNRAPKDGAWSCSSIFKPIKRVKNERSSGGITIPGERSETEMTDRPKESNKEFVASNQKRVEPADTTPPTNESDYYSDGDYI